MSDRPSWFWPYLAGLLDGEGAVGIIRYRRARELGLHYHPYIQISMTHRELISWLKSLLGGSASQRQRLAANRFGYKPMYAVRWGYQAAYRIAKAVLPYLRVKRPQAEIIRRWYEEGVKPSGGAWRWHTDEIRARQMALWSEMKNLQMRRGKSDV